MVRGCLLALVFLLIMSPSSSVPISIKFDQKILVAVVSSPSHYKARAAIRNTWAPAAKSLGMDVKFFVGQLPPSTGNAEQENLKISGEPDMIRLNDFQESYHNLTAKAIDIFSYASDHGFVGCMKVDDDTFLDAASLKSLLDSHDLHSIWAGNFVTGNSVSKDPNGRWYAYDQYPFETWPSYPNGPGFFLGSKAIKYIADHRTSLNRIRIDDAAVGVWLQDLHLETVTMDVNLFHFDLHPHVVWTNPVNHTEMAQLARGDVLRLQACTSGDTACLCSGNPSVSAEEHRRCWERTTGSIYQDVIPRLAST